MDYISLHRRFFALHREAAFVPADTHAYWVVVDLFNAKGQGGTWPETIQLTDGALASAMGLNVKTMDSARGRLATRGLIMVERFGQGARSGATYRLMETGSTSVKTSPKTSVKNGEVNAKPLSTSVKIGEVVGEVRPQLPQQLPQQPLQKHLQFLPKFYYIDTKHQTPDSQTLKKTLLVACCDEFEVRLALFGSLRAKRKKKPPGSARPPAVSPPSVVTLIKNLIESRVDGYYWQAKDGAAAKQIGQKLQHLILKKQPVCLDADIINALTVMLDRSTELSAYYQFTDLPTLNGKFNEIVTQLRIPRTVKPAAGFTKPVAPAHATPEQRHSKVAAIFERIDHNTGRSGGG